MKIASRTMVATLAFVAVMAAAGNMVRAQVSTKPPQSGAMASSATAASPNVAQLQATADQTASKIQASSSSMSALVSAVRTKNVDRASALLLQNGFTAKQLQGAKIELVDKTGGSGGGGTASKIKVTITVKCCPASITITVSW